MTIATEGSFECSLSGSVRQELELIELRVGNWFSAKRVWERSLSEYERELAGGDLNKAYCQWGTIGIWQKAKGGSLYRAMVDVARALNAICSETQQWLLRELGEIFESEDDLPKITAHVALVLVESPRAAFWRGHEIKVEWERRSALWTYFMTLCSQAQLRATVDSTHFGEHCKPDYHIKQKSRLVAEKGFPLEVADLIQTAGCGAQRLNVAPDQIRIFERVMSEQLRTRA